jgi:hypothetical protein
LRRCAEQDVAALGDCSSKVSHGNLVQGVLIALLDAVNDLLAPWCSETPKITPAELMIGTLRVSLVPSVRDDS